MNKTLYKLRKLVENNTDDIFDYANFIVASEKYIKGEEATHPVQSAYMQELIKLQKASNENLDPILRDYIKTLEDQCIRYFHEVDFQVYLKDARSNWTLGITDAKEKGEA